MRQNMLLNNKVKSIIVDVHDDMLKDKFWKQHSSLLSSKQKEINLYKGQATDIINEQTSLIIE